MEFLVQTEEKLAVEISGNLQSLMEQQKTHEVREYSYINDMPDHPLIYVHVIFLYIAGYEQDVYFFI